MADGPDEPNPEDGKILSPDELDIGDDEHVTELSEGRYVVSPDVRTDSPTPPEPEPMPEPDPEPTSEPERNPEPESEPEGKSEPERTPEPERTFSDAEVHEWLADQMADSSGRYGFDMTAKFDGEVDQQKLGSNDVVTVFETLLMWYGRQLDGSTDVQDVLGILLSESNVPVKYPPGCIKGLARSMGLSPDDSIADLVAAVEDRDGAEFR